MGPADPVRAIREIAQREARLHVARGVGAHAERVRALPRAGSAAHARREGSRAGRSDESGDARASAREAAGESIEVPCSRTRDLRVHEAIGTRRRADVSGRPGNAPFSSPRRRSRGALRHARRRTLLARYAARRDRASERARRTPSAFSPPRVARVSAPARLRLRRASSSRRFDFSLGREAKGGGADDTSPLIPTVEKSLTLTRVSSRFSPRTRIHTPLSHTEHGRA